MNQPVMYLKAWRHKGREGPRHTPSWVTLAGEPYWARVFGLMDESGKLQLMINVQDEQGRKLAVPYYSELLQIERTHVLPPRPAKLKHCRLELYPA